jgi:hypothetical protein
MLKSVELSFQLVAGQKEVGKSSDRVATVKTLDRRLVELRDTKCYEVR